MFMLNVKINKKNPHYMKEHIPTTTISFKTSLRLLCLSASVMLCKEASDSSSICLNSYHVLSDRNKGSQFAKCEPFSVTSEPKYSFGDKNANQ